MRPLVVPDGSEKSTAALLAVCSNPTKPLRLRAATLLALEKLGPVAAQKFATVFQSVLADPTTDVSLREEIEDVLAPVGLNGEEDSALQSGLIDLTGSATREESQTRSGGQVVQNTQARSRIATARKAKRFGTGRAEANVVEVDHEEIAGYLATLADLTVAEPERANAATKLGVLGRRGDLDSDVSAVAVSALQTVLAEPGMNESLLGREVLEALAILANTGCGEAVAALVEVSLDLERYYLELTWFGGHL